MALTTFHSASDFEEVIETEEINPFIDMVQLPPTTAQLVAMVVPGTGTIPQRFTRTNAFTVPASTKTEGGDFTLAEIDTEENSITAGFVGFAFRQSDEAMLNSRGKVQVAAIVEALQAMDDRMDSDAHGASTSATQITGADTDVFTVANFRSALHAYQAYNIRAGAMGHACVLHTDAWADLHDSMSDSAATLRPSEAISLMAGPSTGYMGSFMGMEIFVSTNVSTTGSGYSNYMTPIGLNQSGLGIVVSEPVRIIPTRGDTMELAAGSQFVVRALYGTGVRNAEKLVEVLSRDA